MLGAVSRAWFNARQDRVVRQAELIDLVRLNVRDHFPTAASWSGSWRMWPTRSHNASDRCMS
jgi:hypothetical protein